MILSPWPSVAGLFCLKSLMLWSSLAGLGAADDFTCGDYANALDLGVGTDFQVVSTTLSCSSSFTKGILPAGVNWHIHVMEQESAPKYTAYPVGMLQPVVSDSTLKFEWTKALDGVSSGSATGAAVELFLPYTLVNTINSGGIGDVIEVINTNSSGAPAIINIGQSGTNSSVYVNSPVSPVNLSSSGTEWNLEADVASGSTFSFSGTGIKASILNQGDELEVTMTGTDQTVTIQGSYSSVEVSGVGCTVNINDSSGCTDVSKTGVDIKCNAVSTEVMVTEPACLSDTTATTILCSTYGSITDNSFTEDGGNDNGGSGGNIEVGNIDVIDEDGKTIVPSASSSLFALEAFFGVASLLWFLIF